MDAQIHSTLGPVGAGRSTLARSPGDAHRAVPLVLDDWRARRFGADERPAAGRVAWHLERRHRCLERIWTVTAALRAVGARAVLEIGLIRREEREALYGRVDEAGHPLAVSLIDAPREVRRERVMRRNDERGATFAQVVALEFFELARDRWAPPCEQERVERAIAVP